MQLHTSAKLLHVNGINENITVFYLWNVPIEGGMKMITVKLFEKSMVDADNKIMASITLPSEAEEIKGVLRAVGIESPSDCLIDDVEIYDDYIDYDYMENNLFIEDTNLNELNYLANRLLAMDINERYKWGELAVQHDYRTFKELISLTFDLEAASVIKDSFYDGAVPQEYMILHEQEQESKTDMFM